MSDPHLEDETRLSDDDAKMLIKAIEDVEREECEAQDKAKQAE